MGLYDEQVQRLIDLALQGDIFQLARDWNWPDSRDYKKALRKGLLSLSAEQREQIMSAASARGTASDKMLRDSLYDMQERGGQMSDIRKTMDYEVDVESRSSGKIYTYTVRKVQTPQTAIARAIRMHGRDDAGWAGNVRPYHALSGFGAKWRPHRSQHGFPRDVLDTEIGQFVMLHRPKDEYVQFFPATEKGRIFSREAMTDVGFFPNRADAEKAVDQFIKDRGGQMSDYGAKRRAKVVYRVEGKDDDYKTRDMLPYASGGHKISVEAADLAEAQVTLADWLKSHPPLGRDAKAWIEEAWSDGSHFTIAEYVPSGDKWIPRMRIGRQMGEHETSKGGEVSVKALREAFKLSEGDAKKIIKAIDQAKSHEDIDQALDDANEFIGGYGVEAVRGEGYQVDRYYYDIIALYVNMGDTYSTTLLYDTENGEWLITSWGDFFEAWEGEHQEESEEEEGVPDEPDEEDLTTEDHIHFYSAGELVVTLEEGDDMWGALEEWMGKNHFYPNVWFISDHGNAHLMTKG